MSCEDCLATAIRAKLGRCPVCAAQTFLIGVVGWLVWWWCGADTSVNALTGLLFALGGSGLFLLHLVVFAWRKLGKRDI
ncbi:DUF3624 domain-containing protein [Aeromonas caviae]|jgi:hypothetical protein|uniref:DUF3624 domain-containing protein n=1 Tax=Aeromonas caviae TaxID=648 RepID=UPI00191E8482|nr:DUF3624 domain-containing protein [Aeromonas caviae]MBL0650046.1 DUF3624 domain-containing protein [Aeromonas caviae]MCX4036343.1 DUF3624 domain-containing protein [Aeromonas caviae]MCY9812238.1 DUF3624 domain-containing protein [Aeromonas caviae]ULH01463.1 DUF3624 domain-containing protein [Aeromonas caviae]WDV27899.1 DUF3624 domain-containing protein [Aeromonas caviae]